MPLFDLVFVKPLVIVGRGEADAGVAWRIGLNEAVPSDSSRPARPATWVIRKKPAWQLAVIGHEQRRVCRDHAHQVTLGKSSPLAIIFVPIRMSASRFAKALRMARCEPFLTVVSLSIRVACAMGKAFTASSTCRVPWPKYLRYGFLHSADQRNVEIRSPQ